MSKSWLKTPQEQLRNFGDLFDTKRDFSKSDFDGRTYEPKFDSGRLRGEMARVYNCLITVHQAWWTFPNGPEIPKRRSQQGSATFVNESSALTR